MGCEIGPDIGNIVFETFITEYFAGSDNTSKESEISNRSVTVTAQSFFAIMSTDMDHNSFFLIVIKCKSNEVLATVHSFSLAKISC